MGLTNLLCFQFWLAGIELVSTRMFHVESWKASVDAKEEGGGPISIYQL